ncbi:MAG: ABC transporter ATP-binding protein [Spirochaetaceae bacterium]|nr:ABC transporter ATP-binding protein [Spirochaetaceae bacterium]
MTDKEIILEANNIVTGYKNSKSTNKVTNDFSFSINKNSITVIIGPNGSGKTTLLKTISGIIKPLSGDIFYLLNTCTGRPMHDPCSLTGALNSDKMDAVAFAKARSVVLSKSPETGMLTVFEIISLGRFPYTGWKGNFSEQDHYEAEKALREIGIESLSKRIFKTLSDGEKQKVMIARALAQNTPLIFFDEPAAFLDLPSKVELSKLIADISKNKTVIITTHDIDFALNYSDELWIIDRDGTIHAGTPEKLFKVIENIFKITLS